MSKLGNEYTEDIKSLLGYLEQPKNILITSHRNPDGDAVGSALALKYALEARFHRVKVVFPSEFPDNLAWIHGSEEALIYDRDGQVAIDAVKDAHLIFCMDFNSLDRIDKVGDAIKHHTAPIVTIDHHLYPDNFSTLLFSVPEISSTCELLYELFKAMNWHQTLHVKALEALLTGIITDTGSFKYSISTDTFANTGEMINKGADIQYVQDRLFNHNKEKSLRLLGHSLFNRMKIYPEHKAGLIYLNKSDYMDFNIQRGDTEGIVNYMLQLDDVHVAAFITEQPSIIKISLRSKGNFSVEKMAKEYFNGGGHKNASGGSSYDSLKNVIWKFESAIEKYKSEIINTY